MASKRSSSGRSSPSNSATAGSASGESKLTPNRNGEVKASSSSKQKKSKKGEKKSEKSKVQDSSAWGDFPLSEEQVEELEQLINPRMGAQPPTEDPNPLPVTFLDSERGIDDSVSLEQQGVSPYTEQSPTSATHAEIRVSIATHLATTSPQIGVHSLDLSLAVHPWPDTPLSGATRIRLAAELLPWSNLSHPSIYQVAADRLLRFSDVLAEDTSLPEFVTMINAAAERLGRAGLVPIFSPYSDALNSLSDPTGIYSGHRGSASGQETDPVDELSTTHPANLPAAISVFSAVLATGSWDLGVNLGQEETGTSIADFLRLTRYSEILENFRDWFDEQDEVEKHILRYRTFPLPGTAAETLEEVGLNVRLTRERVRQREKIVLESLKQEFQNDLALAAKLLEPAKQKLVRTTNLNTAIQLLDDVFDDDGVAVGAILWSAGKWVSKNGWSHHESLASRLHDRVTELLQTQDDYGILPTNALEELNGLFATTEQQMSYFEECLDLFNFQGLWCVGNTKSTRIAVGLRLLGRPGTLDEIRDSAGMPATMRINETLKSMSPSVIRIDNHRWGFATKDSVPYDGISAAIKRRISEGGGSASVRLIKDQLPRELDVALTSVLAYLASSVFLVKDGYVSLSETSDYSADNPSKWSDSKSTGGLWGQLITLDSQNFLGYSLRVRYDIAYANGLRPDSSLHVQIEGTVEKASLIWRSRDVHKFIDVGCVSDALKVLGFKAGDQVIVVPSADLVRFVRPEAAKLDGDDQQSGGPDTPTETGTGTGTGNPLLGFLEDP